jgi:nitrile hydratase
MDGVHDLGGVQGFGPLEIDRDEPPFHHDWEARMWGLNEAMTGDPGWTIDWWRHVRLILPLDYLSRPYLTNGRRFMPLC